MLNTVLQTTDWRGAISPPDEIIAEAKAGRMVILADDEDRENEGDLVIPAEKCDAAAVNFMATHGRGLICLALEKKQVDQLGLPMMTNQNKSHHETAFTISIEARDGVTTGISAADRARTIEAAIAPNATPQDVVSPGHIFPLVAKDGGVLVRTGHTEAAVDIARLAGFHPSGVICEIMNEDGTMARLPDLVAFAQRHGIKVGTIADLIAYRRKTEKLVERVVESTLNSTHGGAFQMIVYANKAAYAEHIALVKGDVTTGGPVLVRMHALHVLDDALGDQAGGKQDVLQRSMRQIADSGRGVIVLLREASPTMLSDLLRGRGDASAAPELRDCGVGAQILLDLGVRDMVLLSDSNKTVVGLEGYGLRITGYERIGA
jgi:3,4-dihydroxy 2-butanone 4-phosphate synthase / GTP cyclohydrolase II